MSKHIIYPISIRFYVYGGQDLKEGSFGDMWKLSVDYMYNDAVKVDAEKGTEIEGKEWKQVTLTGKFPAKIAHHQSVV